MKVLCILEMGRARPGVGGDFPKTACAPGRVL